VVINGKRKTSRDYKSIQMESGRNAEQRKKQKMKQQFFYAYLEDPRETKSKYDSSIASQLSEPGPLWLLQNVLLLHQPIFK
jgi:hypothetical protein